MKNIILLLLLGLSVAAMSQDKIVKKTGEIINCRVSELNTTEVKYYYETNPKVVFGLDKALIVEVQFGTGEVVKMETDGFGETEYYADQNKHALKLNFLSPLAGSSEFVYEQSVKPGKSWEVGLGIIGLGFNSDDLNAVGAYGKFAYKFMRTPDFYSQRMHYSHILKGAYFAPELAFRYTKFDSYNYSNNYYDPATIERVDDFAFALTLKLGKQWVFDDSFLVDLFWGIGYGMQTQEEELHYGFITTPDSDIPIAMTGGLRIGWTF